MSAVSAAAQSASLRMTCSPQGGINRLQGIFLFMATEKQISANRANAKRSTGPRTVAGKCHSAQNAYRHGLSRPLPDDIATSSLTDAVAGAVKNCFRNDLSTEMFALAQMELLRIR